MQAPKDLSIVHKSLYKTLKKEIAFLERKKKKEILKYEASFRRSYPKKILRSNRNELRDAILKSDVVLIGDFHTFRQSQKGFLRLLEDSLDAKHSLAIGLECFMDDAQIALDEFINGLITAEELREKVDFEKFWPFPWLHYKEILTLAQKHKIRVLALNIHIRSHVSNALKRRDTFAAEAISHFLQHHSAIKLFVLYGELHLAHPHLPLLVKKQAKDADVLVIHQNQPSIYWKYSAEINSHKMELFKHSAREFCVINSVPWVRERSYLDWLEGNPDDLSIDSSSLDINEYVLQFSQILNNALALNVELDSNFEVQALDEQQKQFLLRESKQLRGEDRLLFRYAMEFQRVAPIIGTKKILLSATNTNSLSEAAAELLWLCKNKWSASIVPIRSNTVTIFFVGYLGSKLLNPKRKCNEIGDLFDAIRSSKTNISQKKIYRYAISLLNEFLPKKGKSMRLSPLTNTQKLEASRIVGFILADRFFHSLYFQQKKFDIINRFFSFDSNSPIEFKNFKKELRLFLGASKIAPLKKSEKF